MAHKEQQDFCKYVKSIKPHFFKQHFVLDCGALDVNGNNRYLFDECGYIGIDVAHGPNVDIACPTYQFQAKDGLFDVVISTECFEHDMHWAESIWNIIRMLRGGGLFMFTCATNGRAEHGTVRSDQNSAPLLAQQGQIWANYYKNLTQDDFEYMINFTGCFKEYEWKMEPLTKDIYFWGIRNDVIDPKEIFTRH